MALENDPPYVFLQNIRRKEFADLQIPRKPSNFKTDNDDVINEEQLRKFGRLLKTVHKPELDAIVHGSYNYESYSASSMDRNDALSSLNYILDLTEQRHPAKL
jgi:hypothetical protein